MSYLYSDEERRACILGAFLSGRGVAINSAPTGVASADDARERWMTAREISGIVGYSVGYVRRLCREAVADGALEVRQVRLAGPMAQNVYRVTPAGYEWFRLVADASGDRDGDLRRSYSVSHELDNFPYRAWDALLDTGTDSEGWDDYPRLHWVNRSEEHYMHGHDAGWGEYPDTWSKR